MTGPEALTPDEAGLAIIAKAELADELRELEALRTDPNVLKFATVVGNPPRLPAATSIELIVGETVNAIGPFFHGEPLDRVIEAVEFAHSLFARLGTPKGAGDAQPTAISYAKMRRTFAQFNIDSVVSEINRLEGGTEGFNALTILPLILLHTAANALMYDTQARRAREGQIDEVVHAEIDQEVAERLKAACDTLAEGERLTLTGTDNNALRVAESALFLLDACGLYGYSREDKMEITQALLPRYFADAIRTGSKLTPDIMRTAFLRFTDDLEGFGITLRLPNGTQFNLTDNELADIHRQAAKEAKPGGPIDIVYAKLGAYYYADTLSIGISDGGIDYVKILNAVATANDTPLKALIVRRAAEQEAKRMAELARLADMGYINATMSLAPAHELARLLVPPGQGRPRASQQSGPTSGGGETHEVPASIADMLREFKNLQPYRAYVLARLIEELPGSEIHFRELKKGTRPTAGSPETGFDVRRTERYIFLVTPKGHVIAEFPEADHATLLMRAEILRDGETWDQLFELTVDELVERGVVRIKHPRQPDLVAHPLDTAELYVHFLQYLLVEDLGPDLRLPNSERIRVPPRVTRRELGRTATQAEKS